MSNGDGQGRLAHTTSANDAHESRDDQRSDGADAIVTADHLLQAWGRG
jgi:hypothetical protein